LSPPGAWLPAVLLASLHAQRDELLQLEARRKLHRLVEDYPGLHLAELARLAGLEANHAKYHLAYMEKHGLVSSRDEDGYWRFFPRAEGPLGPQESVSAQDKQALALLRQPVPLHVVLILLEHGAATHGDIERQVKVGRTTLHYHVQKLLRAGILVGQKEGRERRYSLAEPDRLRALLLRYRPPDALVQGFLEAWEAVSLP
jgi:predicted transcriptional regulator